MMPTTRQGGLRERLREYVCKSKPTLASNSYNAGKAADKAGPHPHDAMEGCHEGR